MIRASAKIRCAFLENAHSISLLVVLGVREDSQKAARDQEHGKRERRGLARGPRHLIRRGLRRPEFLIVDGAAGLDKAIAAVWADVPVQRCTVHKLRARQESTARSERLLGEIV
jgi:putative transposase